MTWCIHNACSIRDKAQRPSAFKSQPSGRLTCSTPELGAQLNLTNDQKKKKAPYLQGCPIAWSWKKRWSQAQRHVVQHIDVDRWDLEKRPTVSHYLHELLIQKCKSRQKKGESLVQRAAVATQRHRRVRPGKKASSSHYLDELLIQKCKFRGHFTVHC